MKSKKIFIYSLLFGITLSALILRIIKLSGVPPGLNRDEVAIGYNAYSLLKTGKDEYGITLPISFKSFGDWKLPLYIYLTVPFVRLFGLTEFAVRFPSAFLGTLSVALVYFLVTKLFEISDIQSKDQKEFSLYLGLLSSLLVAISPWHIFMSRNASESNVAVFFIISSLVLLFNSFRIRWLLIPSFMLLAFSLFTYHGNHVFTPFLFIGILIFFGKKLKANKWFVSGVVIFILLAGLIYSETLFVADKTKISGLFPLGNISEVHEQIDLRREEHSIQFFAKILHNKPLVLSITYVQNYLKSFSPEFLFISGGSNFQHNIPDFGNLYLWQASVLVIAVYVLVKKRTVWSRFLLYWLLVAPLASSLTRDAPHTNRLMVILPLPEILSAYGAISLTKWFRRKKIFLPGALILGLVVAGNFGLFLDRYFVHFPQIAAKHWGSDLKSLVLLLPKEKEQYSEIIVGRPEISPYIYYLFYNNYNPEKFQREVVRYSSTSDGFQHVKQLENITFRKINWPTDLLIPGKLYIDWIEGVPQEATDSSARITPENLATLKAEGRDISLLKPGMMISSKLVDTLYLSNGKPQLYSIRTKLEEQ